MVPSAKSGTPLRVLLTEANTISARQIVTVLGLLGHHVEVLTSGGVALTALSRFIRARHRVPPFGIDPLGYADAVVDLLNRRQYDVLLPTHEQLALLAAAHDRFAPLVGLAVPDFPALAAVQDKASAVEALTAAGVLQPATTLVTDAAGLRQQRSALPAYVKLPISTASRGLWLVDDPDSLDQLADSESVSEAFRHGLRILVQQPVAGQVVNGQSVFSRGELLCCHVSARSQDGVNGGAAAKVSLEMPALVTAMEDLGRHLRWHGPLSVDAVVDAAGVPHVIDINPRLVEPVNGYLAGADLVECLLAVSTGQTPTPPRPVVGRAGVRTHALMMALLRRGETAAGRLAILKDLAGAVTGTGWCANSREEVLPARWDPPGALLTAGIAGMLLAYPRSWRWFVGTQATSESLGVSTWQTLLTTAAEVPPATAADLPPATTSDVPPAHHDEPRRQDDRGR